MQVCECGCFQLTIAGDLVAGFVTNVKTLLRATNRCDTVESEQ
jgi:hypothetical protein